MHSRWFMKYIIILTLLTLNLKTLWCQRKEMYTYWSEFVADSDWFDLNHSATYSHYSLNRKYRIAALLFAARSMSTAIKFTSQSQSQTGDSDSWARREVGVLLLVVVVVLIGPRFLHICISQRRKYCYYSYTYNYTATHQRVTMLQFTLHNH